MIGKTVSHYRIVEKLGGGGMGVVYKAEDTKLGRKVALKLIRSSEIGTADSVQRFLFEARATARFALGAIPAWSRPEMNGSGIARATGAFRINQEAPMD